MPKVLGCALASLVFTLAAAGTSAAATYYVDNGHPSASDAGPGTESAPYRTISAAVNQRGGPGATIVVRTGTYPEQVTVSAAGAPDAPLVIRALGEVVLEGSDDYANAMRWSLVSGSTWLASSVTWDPNQVFVAGRRLVKTTMTTLPPNTFRWVAGTGLQVNVAGGNPGLQGARVGHRDYGFRVIGRPWVTLQGFTVMRADIKAIYAAEGSHHATIENIRALWSGGAGIQVAASTGARISRCEAAHNGDHGFLLTLNATGALVRRNRSHHNARLDRGGANGFHLFSAPGNRLEGNEAFDNQDSGFQINGGSNQVVSVHNRSWSNDDHGFDHLGSSGTIHVGDVASANARDGFSFEGSAPGGQLHNSIAVNNGSGLFQYNLWVDPSSQPGFVSDFNVLWNANGQAVARWGATPYVTVAAFAAATGNDRQTRQADPRFVNPAAGDFHLLAGSAAIDAAHSGVAQWPALDADGRAPFDVVGVANEGAGPVLYADRGAFEFVSGGSVDAAPLVFAPTRVSGDEANRLTIRVTARDPDGDAIHSLTADLSGLPRGHDAKFIVAAGDTAGTLTWTPTYEDSGTYRVVFRAANALAGTAATSIYVRNVDRAPIVSAPPNIKVAPGTLISFQVTARDPDGDAITSLTADLDGATGATFVVNATRTLGTFTWTPGTSAMRNGKVGNFHPQFTARNALTGTFKTHIQVKASWGLEADGVDESIPATLALSPPRPNPSRDQLAFALDLPADAAVEFAIYDLQGRQVWNRTEAMSAGRRTLRWDGVGEAGGRVGSGVFYARVRVGDRVFTHRVVRW